MVRILILGGGFGGVITALGLGRKLADKAEITLVDKNYYHLFVPSLYEVASAYDIGKDPFAIKLKKSVCIPYSDIFDGKNVNFIQAEVTGVDLSGKKVKTGDTVLEYDYLVIGLGGETNDFGIPGIKEYAYQFKNIEDALMINKKIESLVDKFMKGEGEPLIRIFVCGGGFTGVELVAELASYLRKLARIKGIKKKYFKATLFEAGPKILPMISERKRKIIARRLTRLGVSIMENSHIEEVGGDFIKLKSGQTMNGELVVWSAGVKASGVLKNIAGLPLSPSGKIIVDEYMQAKELENVFALGDNAEFIDSLTQKPVPALGYVAHDQGEVVAGNIISKVKNQKLKKYRPYYSGWIAPVGGKFAVAHVRENLNINGLSGWLLRWVIDFRYMLSILSLKKSMMLFWREVTLFTKND